MKRLILLLLFIYTFFSLMAQNTKSIPEAMNNYDYETAIALINKEKPTIPLLFQKAKALKGLTRSAEALHVYQQVIAEEPENQQALIEAAECCKLLTKYNEALKYYQQVLDVNPQNKYARLQYIGLLCQQKKYQEAFGESSVLAEADSSAVVLHLQAQSLEGMNQMLPAIGCYLVIQDKYPTDYLAAAKLGNLYNELMDYKYAIEATEKYRAIDSTNIIVNRQNALAYCLSQDYQTAVKRYEYLISQGDSTIQTCYYLGVSYYAAEKFYEAHDMLEIVYAQDPENVNLLYYLGRACAKTSWKKQGVAHLEKAIELTIPTDSTMIRLYKGAVDCYKMANMFKEQVDGMRDQYRYDRSNHRLLYDMAIVYNYSLKDSKNAERCLEAFLKTKPKENKEKPAELNAKGEVELGLESNYNAAQQWLNDIRKEKFFKEGAPKKE